MAEEDRSYGGSSSECLKKQEEMVQDNRYDVFRVEINILNEPMFFPCESSDILGTEQEIGLNEESIKQ